MQGYLLRSALLSQEEPGSPTLQIHFLNQLTRWDVTLFRPTRGRTLEAHVKTGTFLGCAQCFISHLKHAFEIILPAVPRHAVGSVHMAARSQEMQTGFLLGETKLEDALWDACPAGELIQSNPFQTHTVWVLGRWHQLFPFTALLLHRCSPCTAHNHEEKPSG